MDLWTTALAAWENRNLDAARILLEELLTSAPGDIPAQHLYGVVSSENGAYEEAIRYLELVCRAEADNIDALFDLVNAQRLAGKLLDAEASLRQGIARHPDNSHLAFNLGVVLCSKKQPDDAEKAFRRAVELDPRDQAAWFQLGLLRYARSDHLNAATALLLAADLGGADSQQAVRLAGFALADGGRPEQAEGLLSSLCPERPEETLDFQLLSQLMFCRLELCNWRRLPEMAARCKQFLAEGRPPLEPFTFLLLPEITALEQLALTASFAASLLPDQALPEPVITDPDPMRRLRVAYLSADFHDHAVMRLLIGTLEHHDHVGFEIHAFSYGGPNDDAMRRRIVAACDCFHDVEALRPDMLAQRIRDNSIDILIDLTGWSGNTRTATLGYRPTPIQVNFLGYSGTLGSRTLADYLIGDPISTPLSHQNAYAEELILMSHCCHPNDSTRPIGCPRTRQEEALPDNAFVFCCFSRPLKITRQIFQCWCDLLLKLPGSVLWLYAPREQARENLRAEARERGLDDSRLVFSNARPPEEHLARLALADLALDTFPFGAHTTASDALWAGLPVLTMTGETLASRVTASMLNTVGLGDMVTGSIDEYRARAIELASNPEALEEIRNRLSANRLSTALFDTQRFTVELEARLRQMWQRKIAAE